MRELLNRCIRVLLAFFVWAARMLIAEWRRRRTRRSEHDTVSCSLVDILPEVIMCGYYEVVSRRNALPSFAIDTCLRESGCTCDPLRWSCFESVEGGSSFKEFVCRGCGATVQLHFEQPSTTPSNREEDS